MNAVWLLQVEATISTEDLRVESALDSLNTLTSLARGLAMPDAADLTQSGMVLLAACGSGERLIGRNVLTTQQLRKLQRVFRSSQSTNALPRHLVVLRCRAYFKFKHWQERIIPYLKAMNEFDRDRPVSLNELEKIVTDFAENKDANLLCFLEEMERLVEISRLPAPEMLRTARLKLLAIKEQLRNPENRRLAFALGEIRRTIEGEVFTFAQLAAMWRTAETAAAVEEYRMDHDGRTPSAVTVLVPTYVETTPLDPFDGEPLRIRQFANGYCVYSIGESDTGNSYRETGAAKSKEMNEIKFVVERCLK